MRTKERKHPDPPALPFGTSQVMQACSRAPLELQSKTIGEPTTELLLEWILFAQSGVCLKCPRGSPTLPPFPSPQFQAPGGQADRLLPKCLHDFSYPSQVGLGECEVTPSSSHVIANHACLGGGDKAFRLGCDHIFARVQ